MDATDLRRKLEEAQDKFSVFVENDTLSDCTIRVIDLVSIINEFLTDEEKVKLLNLPHFQSQSTLIKSYIASNIVRDRVKLNLLEDEKFVSELNSTELESIITTLGSYGSYEILKKGNQMKLSDACKEKLVNALTNDDKEMLLFDKELLEQLQFSTIQIKEFICSLRETENKCKLLSDWWIKNTINSMPVEWNNLQKIAYIDNSIGRKISYSIVDEPREKLWSVVYTGYGNCQEIAELEQHMLNEIGINSEIIGNNQHKYLKVLNVDIQTPNGVVNGNTYIDPSWNLKFHRYGGYPQCFCLDYDNMRKNDIDKNGIDTECHKLENEDPNYINAIRLEDQCLRQVYRSIGVIKRDDNLFPIKSLIDKSNDIAKENIQNYDLTMNQRIDCQLNILPDYDKNFAKCYHETAFVLQNILFNNEYMNIPQYQTKIAYEKNKTDSKPVLYVEIECENEGKQLFYADENTCSFRNITQNEFEEKFC